VSNRLCCYAIDIDIGDKARRIVILTERNRIVRISEAQIIERRIMSERHIDVSP
jgi:hypothetical protein